MATARRRQQRGDGKEATAKRRRQMGDVEREMTKRDGQMRKEAKGRRDQSCGPEYALESLKLSKSWHSILLPALI